MNRERFAKSMCQCGHTGDTVIGFNNSDHGGLMGLGACMIPECKCGRFHPERLLTDEEYLAGVARFWNQLRMPGRRANVN